MPPTHGASIDRTHAAHLRSAAIYGARVRVLLVAFLAMICLSMLGGLYALWYFTTSYGHRSVAPQELVGSDFPPPDSKSIIPTTTDNHTTRAWHPPPVDRDMLAAAMRNVELLNDPFPDDLSPTEETTTTPTWPPLVTRLPPLDATPSFSPRPKFSFDQDPPLRFLLPYRISSRGPWQTKDMLMQMSLLSRALGRVLVLPNTGKGRIGACFRWPMSDVYDMVSSDKELGGIVDFEEFRKWVNKRSSDTTAQVVYVSSKAKEAALDPQLWNLIPVHLEGSRSEEATLANENSVSVYASATNTSLKEQPSARLSCVPSKFPRLSFDHPPLSVFIPDLPRPGSLSHVQEQIQQSFLGALQLTHDQLDASLIPTRETVHDTASQVLVLDYAYRPALFAPSFSTISIAYSNKLGDMARRISNLLGDYIAIDWSIAPTDTQLLAHTCATALRSALRATSLGDKNNGDATAGGQYAWIVTLGAEHNSIVEATVARVRDILSGTDAFQGARVSHLGDALHLLRRRAREEDDVGLMLDLKDAFWSDAGVRAALDELVTRESSWFLAPSKVCGGLSSLGKTVRDYRKRTLRAAGAVVADAEFAGESADAAHGRKLQNVVAMFG